MARIKWDPVLKQAKQIVNSYGGDITLRQLFYLLVSNSTIPNTRSYYGTLSSKTSEARRAGKFPSLVDHTRSIQRPWTVNNPADALRDVIDTYRLDRLKDQNTAIYLGAEKATMQSLLDRWFGDYGFPVILLRGYSSQTYCDQVSYDVLANAQNDDVLIYAGDLDPSGMDIERDFNKRTNYAFTNIVRIAVTPSQLNTFNLIKQPGKITDPRAKAFKKKYGGLFQVEVEAIDPTDLRQLYQTEIDKYFEQNKYDRIVKRETKEQEQLRTFAKQWK